MSLICIQNYRQTQIAQAVQGAFDPYWAKVLVAAHFDNAYSGFCIDEKGHALSLVGNATVSSTVPAGFTGNSLNLDGTGDFVSMTDSAEFTLGLEDFTIESWVYFRSYSKNYNGAFAETIYSHGIWPSMFSFYAAGTATSFTSLSIQYVDAAAAYFYASIGFSFQLNRWYHVSVNRKNGSIFFSVDGVIYQPGYNTIGTAISFTDPAGVVTLGKTGVAGYEYELNGYMDDFRLTKGACRYTENFTLPTTAFGDWNSTDYYWNNTVLLMHMEGAVNSTNFVDEKGHAVSVALGSPLLSGGAAKFGSTSAYFNNNMIIQSAVSPDWNITGAMTIEGWIYPLQFTVANVIIGQWTSNQFATSSWVVELDSGVINAYISVGATRYLVAGVAVPLNTWTHFALVKNELVAKLYVNGVASSSTTLPGTPNVSSYPLQIGTCTGAEAYGFIGYMDEIRITKNVARYTQQFNVPAKPFDDATTMLNDPYWAQTICAMHMDGADGSTSLVNSAGSNGIAFGGVTISTTKSKFGGSSLLVPSSINNWATVPNINVGAGDYTIECWALKTTSANAGILHLNNGTPTGLQGIGIGFYSSGFNVAVNGASTTGGASSLNTWHHIALVRSNINVLKVYIDGILVLTLADGVDHSTQTTLHLGMYYSSSYCLAGNIEDVRVTKAARYLGNFMPPIQTFKDQ